MIWLMLLIILPIAALIGRAWIKHIERAVHSEPLGEEYLSKARPDRASKPHPDPKDPKTLL